MPLFGRRPVASGGGNVAEAQRRLGEEAESAQKRAADPRVSAWVSANAGTGKTHVLTNRVLRLLLAGTEPERILALTYTKAAAAEMSKRVFERLAAWTAADDAELAKSLEALLGTGPSAEQRQSARRLFARAIETPGGLKVQTIHAFCERLLQRFPLEAGVSPGFSILDDQQRQALVGEAIEEMLAEAAADKSGPLWTALQTAVAYAVEGNFERLMSEAFRFCTEAGPSWDEEEFEDRVRLLRDACHVRRSVTHDELAAELAGVLSDEVMPGLAAALRSGGVSDQERAGNLQQAIGAASAEGRILALESLFLTQDKGRRARLVTSAVSASAPGVAEQLADAQARFIELHREYLGLTVVEATAALLRLSRDALARYAAAKERLAALDFDDLVRRAAILLQSSEAVAWVLYKLDGRLDHILVDEAQDTSPVQWQVVRSLADEFFSGAGAHEERRTLFAVGDEKQSIYGFQGAAPHMFAETGREFGAKVGAAGLPWEHISLNVSFRTVEPLLQAVDRIFASEGRTPGVGVHGRHLAHRVGQAGLIEIWPTEKSQPAGDTSPWMPLAEGGATHPVRRLAARIAGTIARWLETGERLASEDRPIRAGDILILVRKRMPFAPAMVSALKTRNISVAGADRLVLIEQLAVQDLMALGEFILLPEDDLALAALLKSPLFDLNDDHLMELAPRRTDSLWRALCDRAHAGGLWQTVAERLSTWQAEARRLPPFEFYSHVLDRDGMRAAMLARLGSEAADPLDEFLNQALAYGEDAPHSLQGFLSALRQSNPQIKRDMEQGRDEVRVMTVHGAKGLEAPIVFLPDTCSTRSGSQPGGLVALRAADRGGVEPAFLWPVRGTAKATAVDNVRRAERDEERRERDRLLYVALTRARDRLYVSGFEGAQAPPADCWYNLIRDGLKESAKEVTDASGRTVLRIESAQTAAPEKSKRPFASAAEAAALPAWAGRPAPAEQVLGVPLQPSRLAPLEADEETASRRTTRSAVREPAVFSPRLLADEDRFLRGTLTHALLEHLPKVEPRHRQAAADAFLASRAPELDATARGEIVSETLAVLHHPEFSELFGPQSRAEVPIVAVLPRPGGAGPPLRLAGKIDRLVETGDSVLIVDYKTNRPPPLEVEEVAEAYLLQLAAYRMAVSAIFPGMQVRAALLWTYGARIMEVPAAVLDRHQLRLWTLDPVSLDA